MFILASVNWVHIDNFWRQRNRKKKCFDKDNVEGYVTKRNEKNQQKTRL